MAMPRGLSSVLTIFSIVNLTLIDLPGLTKVAVEEQPERIAQDIEAMVRSFVDKVGRELGVQERLLEFLHFDILWQKWRHFQGIHHLHRLDTVKIKSWILLMLVYLSSVGATKLDEENCM